MISNKEVKIRSVALRSQIQKLLIKGVLYLSARMIAVDICRAIILLDDCCLVTITNNI
jgi:hypothetical protein